MFLIFLKYLDISKISLQKLSNDVRFLRWLFEKAERLAHIWPGFAPLVISTTDFIRFFFPLIRFASHGSRGMKWCTGGKSLVLPVILQYTISIRTILSSFCVFLQLQFIRNVSFLHRKIWYVKSEKKMRHVENWPLIKNLLFLSNPHETWWK